MRRVEPCIRCSGEMDPGFLLDEGHGKRYVARWVAGEPRKSFWFGLSLKGRQPLAVSTYRCRRCGYLESYA